MAVPKGSTVLITGVNGLVGLHVADQYLRNGYKVRGTVRDPINVNWLPDALTRRHGTDNFELVGVPDMLVEGAFDKVTQGIDIFVHTASVMTFDVDPEKVTPIVVAGSVNAIKAAYAEPTVKRFIYTSSMTAAAGMLYDSGDFDETSWNEKAIERYESPPKEGESVTDIGMIVYEASKTIAEREMWNYHKEHRGTRPDLVVNSVLPDIILGPPLDPIGQGFRSSIGLIQALWHNVVTPMHLTVDKHHFVSVEDIALLHYAAGVFPHVQDQRLFGAAESFNWNQVLDVMREVDPERKLPDSVMNGVDVKRLVPRHKAEKLLQDMGRPGWATLRDTILDSIKVA